MNCVANYFHVYFGGGGGGEGEGREGGGERIETLT